MLLFDAGNSRCKWVWLDKGTRLRQGMFDNTNEAAWQALRETFTRLETPGRILVSNVAGAVIGRNVIELCSIWDCPVEDVVAKAEQCGVQNGYAQPFRLGSDRWAALIAAWNRLHKACLVVNCGTATTVDALSDTGEFLGGIILPGLDLMQSSLSVNTAQLGAEISGEAGELRDFPVNTGDAIRSGLILATSGAIRHQYDLLERKYPVNCMISGGAANAILPHLGFQAELVENIVLLGMQIIAQNCLINTEKETVKK